MCFWQFYRIRSNFVNQSNKNFASIIILRSSKQITFDATPKNASSFDILLFFSSAFSIGPITKDFLFVKLFTLLYNSLFFDRSSSFFFLLYRLRYVNKVWLWHLLTITLQNGREGGGGGGEKDNQSLSKSISLNCSTYMRTYQKFMVAAKQRNEDPREKKSKTLK